MLAFSTTGFGAPSTIAFASPSPRPVISLTALITATFCAPASLRTTSNSLFSSAAPASSPPAAGPATATAAAAAGSMPYSSFRIVFSSFTSRTVKLVSSSASFLRSFASFFCA